MADLHCRIRIPIPIPIRTANQMAALYYAELFTLPSQFQIQIPTVEYRNGIVIGIGIAICIYEHLKITLEGGGGVRS